MKNRKPHLVLSKRERSGVFFLLLFVLLVLGIKWLIISGINTQVPAFVLDEELQARHDSVVTSREAIENRIYPFNPNFLDDARGYRLGLSPEELDRLYAYREKGNFLSSGEEFARVTGIPDSLLKILSPYFKFPTFRQTKATDRVSVSALDTPIIIRDINAASAQELQAVRGIGPVLSSRIVRFREALGGFLVHEQLYDVYGLDSAAVSLLLTRFSIGSLPEIAKVDLNSATVDELAALVYISYGLAWDIVRYRERVGKIHSVDELTQFEDFPSDKIDRIGLYLFL